MLLGNMALSMIGMIILSPYIADLLEPFFGIVKNNHSAEDEKQKIEEALNERDNRNTENTDANKESKSTSGDLTDIPSIKDEPKLPDVQGQPNNDVGEMTRNPEAEVVGSEIEYGTKESGSDAE